MKKARVAHEKVIGILLRRPASIADLVELTGFADESLRVFIRRLRSERAVFIESWRRDSMKRHSIAVYRIGDQFDAKKPRARTSAERMALRVERSTVDRPPERKRDKNPLWNLHLVPTKTSSSDSS